MSSTAKMEHENSQFVNEYNSAILIMQIWKIKFCQENTAGQMSGPACAAGGSFNKAQAWMSHKPHRSIPRIGSYSTAVSAAHSGTVHQWHRCILPHEEPPFSTVQACPATPVIRKWGLWEFPLLEYRKPNFYIDRVHINRFLIGQ